MLSLSAKVARWGHLGAVVAGRRRALVPAVPVAAVLVGTAMALGVGMPKPAAATGGPHVASEVPVTATDLIQRSSNNSPELVVDPTESRFVVIANRLDAPFNCSLQVSGDGGRGWLTVTPVPRLPSGVDTCYGPEVAFASDGTLYYLFVGLAGPGNSPVGAFLTTSSDRGRTFRSPRKVLGPERYEVRMALDPTMGGAGRLHLVWLQAGEPASTGLPSVPNPIMTAHSDDGGITFSSPIQISDPGRARVVAPALALGPDHSVDVIYYDLGDDVRDYMGLEGPPWTASTWSLVFTGSTDGGEHFTHGGVVDSNIVAPGRVMLIFTMPPASLDLDGSGRIFVAWHDARNGDWDVFLRRSIDGGQTWSRPVRLNDDPVHDGRDQYLPRLSVSPSGRVDAIFYDRRGNTDNVGVDVYYTWSDDGGVTFARNIQINQLTFSSIVGPRYLVPSAQGLIEFGSRLGLVSRDTQVLAAWTDTSNTRAGVKAQDIMATEIDFSAVPGPADATQRAGLALIGAGLAAGALIAGWWTRSRRAARQRRTRPSRPGGSV